jgi:hypothetical protein
MSIGVRGFWIWIMGCTGKMKSRFMGLGVILIGSNLLSVLAE